MERKRRAKKARAAPARGVDTAKLHIPGHADEAWAFLPDPRAGSSRTEDDMAEDLAEDFLVSATAAEAVGTQPRETALEEVLGGPFVIDETGMGSDGDLVLDRRRPGRPSDRLWRLAMAARERRGGSA